MTQIIQKIVPVTKERVDQLARVLGFGAIVARIGDVEVRYGCGILGPTSKCLWTHDKCRITIVSDAYGTIIASCGVQPDSECPLIQR